MTCIIDGTLYPDEEVPDSLNTFGERIDFIARLCGAWDFGILPHSETVAELCRPDWRESVDACRLLTSPTYHLLRRWHGLLNLPFLGSIPAYILDDPSLEYV